MNTVPEYIVGLWMVPLFIQLVLPLCLLGCWLVVRIPSLFRTPGTATSTAEGRTGIEKRSFRRINADDLRVKISDGKEFFSGVACNISKLGICVMGLPARMYQRERQLSAVVDNEEESFSLHIMPKWQEVKESGGRIGASIEYAQDGWSDFVNRKGHFVLT